MGLAGRRIEVRFDPRDPEMCPKVFLNREFFCDTRPLDLLANAHRPRRRKTTPPKSEVQDPIDAIGDLLSEHYGPEHSDEENER